MTLLPTAEDKAKQAQMGGQAAPEPTNLDQLSALLSGSRNDFIRNLGTWDKVGIIGSMLRNFGNPQAADPVEAMRQQQIGNIQARMQVEQLRRDYDQRQQRDAAIQQFTANMTPAQAAQFGALAPSIQDQILSQQYMAADEATLSNIARQITEATGYPVGSPEHRNLMRQHLSKVQTVGLPGGGVGAIEGLNFNLPSPTTPEEADSLPSGTEFLLPDGTIGRVP